MMKIFRVNEYITLKLENYKTIIYVNNERFDQCSCLLLRDLDKGELEDFISSPSSVDELGDFDNYYPYTKFSNRWIHPETEFWAYSSSFQVWVENGYNTCLMQSNVAFPLLKRLTETGDLKAEQVFKEEIAKRLESDYPPVREYLIRERYTLYLEGEELLFLVLVPEEAAILLEIEKNLVEYGKENFELVIALDHLLAPCFTVKNRHVIEIDLFDCGLDFLPDSIGNLSFLEVLCLRDNNIKKIPKSITNLKKIKLLDLSFNGLNLSKKMLAKLHENKTFYW